MFFVYILLCQDRSLYTGITKDVEKRFNAHLKGVGAKYTRAHLPKKVVHVEAKRTRGSALRRDAAIKKLTRKEKIELIRSHVFVRGGASFVLGSSK